MNLRRWLLVGGASILGAVALMAPSGSSAYTVNDRYQGEINNNTAGSTVQSTQVGLVCTVNAGQTVGVVSASGQGSLKATNATTINYTVTSTGAATNTTVATGSLLDYGDASIAGSPIPCDATGVSVAFDPVCPNESQCDNDAVTGGLNITYVP